MAVAIQVENLSKAYQLGEIGTGSLSRDIERWFAKVRGKEDPFLKIGETNDRTTKGTSDIVWSLQDINFNIEQGDAVGIIGRNGAGKSTLLKLLSRVTSPTTGTIKVKGRIASLLEVGTGFHPELTGRENIYLNGAILGMRKREITRKFDEIVDFSGVERYIDTPVKRYSSGMYVRLAFAVAAYLESEILIVDEVLAVGDAEFQKKCLGKMSDVSKGEGRTVLFVSHNMHSVQKLCNTGILLLNGVVRTIGKIESAIENYLSLKKHSDKYINNDGETSVFIKEVSIIDSKNVESYEILSGEQWSLKIIIECLEQIEHFIVGVNMVNQFDLNIRTSWTSPITITKGNYEYILTESTINFAPGSYLMDVAISTYERNIEYLKMPFSLNISNVSIFKNDSQIINLNSGIINNQFESKLNVLK